MMNSGNSELSGSRASSSVALARIRLFLSHSVFLVSLLTGPRIPAVQQHQRMPLWNDKLLIMTCFGDVFAY